MFTLWLQCGRLTVTRDDGTVLPTCQYQLHQMHKAQAHHVTHVSQYCPLDLFSGEVRSYQCGVTTSNIITQPIRIEHALHQLLASPQVRCLHEPISINDVMQNNLCVFHAGQPVYGHQHPSRPALHATLHACGIPSIDVLLHALAQVGAFHIDRIHCSITFVLCSFSQPVRFLHAFGRFSSHAPYARHTKAWQPIWQATACRATTV